MKKFVLAAGLLVLSSSYALACRGVVEYPNAFEVLAGNTRISGEQKADLMKELAVGSTIHDAGHARNDGSKMRASLKILDALKPKISI